MRIGSFVVSLSGRDEGKIMIVLANEGEYLFLVDGKERKVEKPKKKKVKHAALLDYFEEDTASEIESGSLSNKMARDAVRRAVEWLQN